MASGMEMMVGSVIRAIGLDPEKIMTMANELREEIGLFMAKQDAIVNSLATIKLQLMAIENRLGGAAQVVLDDDMLLGYDVAPEMDEKGNIIQMTKEERTTDER
jgi:hypothetical protein